MKTLLLSFLAALTLASLPLRGQAIDAETYFGDLVPVGDDWYWDDVFGFIYPLGVPWAYIYSMDSTIAIDGTDAHMDVHYTWDANLGWGFISKETAPWMYFYDTDGMVDDMPTIDPGWYYSLGLASGGSAPFSFYESTSGTTVSTRLQIQVVNATGDSPSGTSKVSASDIYLTLYGSSGTFSPSTIELGKSFALGKDTYNFSTTGFSSGRVYVSYKDKMPAQESAINPFSPSVARNDKVELTYTLTGNTPGGSANLTGVDYFGIPMQIETLDATGKVLASFTYYANVDTIKAGLEAINSPKIKNDAVITGTNGFLRVVAPLKWAPGSGAPTASPYPSMAAYFNSVNGKTVNIVGNYDGVPNTYPPSAYNYSCTLASSGNITISGTVAVNGVNPAAGDNIVISAAQLSSGIYLSNPSYTKGGAPGQISDNDVYSAIVRDLLAGFNAGYIGGTYSADPSNTWWGKPPFQTQGGNKYYNQYAAVIQEHSQAYGFPFSDRLRDQLAFFDANTATLRITILPDDFLNAPVATVTSVTNNSLTLKWDAISGATGYQIQYFPPIAGTTVTVSGGTTTTKQITGLSAGTPYTLYVTAVKTVKVTDPTTHKATDKTYYSPAYQLTASTTGTAPQVKGAGQWRANFLLPNGVAQDGDTLIINQISGSLNTTGNVNYNDQRVVSFTSVSGGSGYTSNPTVTLTGGGGFNATAEASLSGTDKVIFVNVGNGGFGYTSAPTVSFSGGGGNGAAFTANLSGNIPVTYLPIPGKLNAQNAYVLKWMRGSTVMFESILYVTLKGYASSNPNGDGGLATIDPDASKTFLVNNRFLPTVGSGQNDPWNLFLTIQPTSSGN